MPLTTDQLTAIDRHLRKENWLLNEDLIAELTDHYANSIEEQMPKDIPFELAMSDIHKGFGGRKGLLEMEEKFVAQAHRVPALAFGKRLKTYIYWPKILIPITLIFLLFQLREYPSLVYDLSIMACTIHGVRTVIVLYLFFRLSGWGKQSRHPFVKKINSFPGLQSAYFLYLTLINPGNTALQCLFLGLWAMEGICTIELLLSDQDFRKLLRIG